MINASISRITLCLIRPRKAVGLEIAFETTSINSVKLGGVGIHITNNDRRCIIRTELPPFLQKHPCDFGVRGLGPGLIVVVWQVSVEKPNYGAIEFELAPSDGTFSIVVPWNAHVATADQGYLAGVKKHIVLIPSLFVSRITRQACQPIPVLALLKADNCWSHILYLCSITANPSIVVSILGVVTHHFQHLAMRPSAGCRRCSGATKVIVLSLRTVAVARLW